MRIALISDIHGNEVALRAVLKDIERAGADRLVCLGDVAALGPRPAEVIRILKDLDCPCIMGNHDAFILEPELIHTYTDIPVIIEALEWCRDRLTPEEKDFIRSFSPHMELALNGLPPLKLVHGSPRSYMEDILATTPPDHLDRMLDGCKPVVLACGHTHVQMLRQHKGMLIVNPGSVGLPFKEFVSGQAPELLLHAEYAMVRMEGGSIGVDLRRVPLDQTAMWEAVAACDNPLREMQLQQYA